MSVMTQILSDALEKATNIDKIDSYAGTAFAFSGSSALTNPNTVVSPPTVVEPDHESFLADPTLWVSIESTSQQFLDWMFKGGGASEKLTALLTAFLAAHFPMDSYDVGVSWINSAIVSGGTGIPPAVEDQIWQRARDRISVDNQKALNAAAAEFASRGMPLPPGALAAQAQQLRLDGLQKGADLSRDVAIRQAEIEIENIKFAVSEAMKMRYAAMKAATDYIGALVGLSGNIIQSNRHVGNIQADLINASANFYNARIHLAELQLRATTATTELALKQEEIGLEQLKAQISGTVQGAVGGASAMGHAVSAALSALNAISVETAEA
jgi:hypothetical protein